MAKNKVLTKTLFIAGTVLCCIFALILVCNLTIIIKGVVNPKVPPSVFGVTPMVVQSGSMSGNAEDHIEVGDLIFTVKPDTDKLKAGDIISLWTAISPSRTVLLRYRPPRTAGAAL